MVKKKLFLPGQPTCPEWYYQLEDKDLRMDPSACVRYRASNTTWPWVCWHKDRQSTILRQTISSPIPHPLVIGLFTLLMTCPGPFSMFREDRLHSLRNFFFLPLERGSLYRGKLIVFSFFCKKLCHTKWLKKMAIRKTRIIFHSTVDDSSHHKCTDIVWFNQFKLHAFCYFKFHQCAKMWVSKVKPTL